MVFWFVLMLSSLVSVGWLYLTVSAQKLYHWAPFIFYLTALLAQKILIGQVDWEAAVVSGVLIFGLQFVIMMGKKNSK